MTHACAARRWLAALAVMLLAARAVGGTCPAGSVSRDQRHGFPDTSREKEAMCSTCREHGGAEMEALCHLGDDGPHPLPECLPIRRSRTGTPRRLAEINFSTFAHPPPRVPASRPEFRSMMPAWEEFYSGASYFPQRRTPREPYKHAGVKQMMDNQGIPYDFDAVYFAPTFHDPDADRMLVPPFRPCIQPVDKLASVVTYWGNAYGHFLLDVLPKLLLLRPFVQHDPEFKFAIVDPEYNNAPGVPAKSRPFLREIFALLGLGAHEILEPNITVAYRARTLRAALYDVGMYMGRAPARETVALLRRFADEAVPYDPGDVPHANNTIVFYSRAEEATGTARDHPDKRVLANEAEVLSAVQAAFPAPRWRVVRFTGEGYTFASSLALFRAARAIIGPAGSGLLNMFFARNRTAVVELLGTDAHWLQFEYYAAGACGLPYYLVPIPGGRYDDPEWRVPPEHVVDTLRDALGES
eukprot:tig00020943_g16320.t1